MGDLIPLEEEEGKRLLLEAESKSKAQRALVNIFSKQIGRSNCGLQSCALVMSAAKVHSLPPDEQLMSRPYTEKNVESSEELHQAVANASSIGYSGLTLDELAQILKQFGHKVEKYYATDVTEVEFCNLVGKALVADSKTGVIVNYHMSTLGQEPFGGHHSPIGAFHEESGRFLVLDTWPDTKECWATVSNLHKAMKTKDNASGLSRGFCVVHFN